MIQPNRKPFTPKTATQYIYNNLFSTPLGDHLTTFETHFSQKHDLSLWDAIQTLVSGLNVQLLDQQALLTTFTQAWDAAYAQEKIAHVQQTYAASEEDSEDEVLVEITLFFEKNGFPLPEAARQVLYLQYQQILKSLEAGNGCVRWLFLDGAQKKQVQGRLLEGLCAICLNLITFHQLSPAQLSTCFQHATIILHGSYLFGAENTPPNDMDVIISDTPCTCKNALLGKLERACTTPQMTIGHKWSVIDLMVGIPLCTPVLLSTYPIGQLIHEVQPLLDQYFASIPGEKDEGKQYRKLVNCALVIQYLLIKSGQDPDADLKTALDKANTAILGSQPGSQGNAGLYTACQKAKKRL